MKKIGILLTACIAIMFSSSVSSETVVKENINSSENISHYGTVSAPRSNTAADANQNSDALNNGDSRQTSTQEASYTPVDHYGSEAQNVDTSSYPLYWDYQWDMKDITNNGESYSLYKTKHKVTVGVVDTGLATDHIDLMDSIGSKSVNLVPKGGFNNEEASETGEQSAIFDKAGHGTEVVGQITAKGNILGVAPGLIINMYRAFGENLSQPEWIAQSIKKAADDNNKIITISAGQYLMITGSYDDGTNDYQDYLTYKDAVDYATHKGSLVVAALGNEGLDTSNNNAMLNYLKNSRKIQVPGLVVDAPTVFKNVLAVGGIDGYGDLSDFSNYSKDAIYAPAGTTRNLIKYGETEFINKGYYLKDWIFTTSSTGGYQYVYGNSFSTPKVAGALALVSEKYNLTDPLLLKNYALIHSLTIDGKKVLNITELLKYANSDSVRERDIEYDYSNNFLDSGIYSQERETKDGAVVTTPVFTNNRLQITTSKNNENFVVNNTAELPGLGDEGNDLIIIFGMLTVALSIKLVNKKNFSITEKR